MSARQSLMAAVLGADADDLRITRVDAATARKDAAAVGDALREQGFFPGRRVVLIEGLTDGAAKPLATAFDGLTAEDAFLIGTADALPARSALRKMFEGDGALVALQLFADAMEPGDVEPALRNRGMTCGLEPDASALLAMAAAGLDHGSMERMLDLVAIFGLGRETPVGLEEVERLLPAGLSGNTDAFIAAVAGGQPDRIGPLLRRLAAEGEQPVGLGLSLQRHFRQLLTAASAPGGPQSGLAALRPPVWGPRRDQMQGQLRRWTASRLEQACRILFETDARLRSGEAAPAMAVLERCALRLAIMGRG